MRAAIVLFLLCVLYVPGGFAQYVEDEFIVELTEQPAVTVRARANRAEQLRRVRSEQQRTRRAIEQGEQAEILDRVETVANALFVRMPRVRSREANAARLARWRGVARVHPVRYHQILLNQALGLQEIPAAWTRLGGFHRAGEGMKIAIVDTGVDATHPGLRDPSLPMPDGFPRVNRESDLQFTNSKVIVARAYDLASRPDSEVTARDRVGHGTAVAMVAAGDLNTGPFGNLIGVAPKAWIGSYKVFPDGQAGAPDTLILKALDDAVADGMDVINLSLGSLMAGRPEEDILASAVERAARDGVIVVVAAGNDGPDPNTISSPATSPSAIAVGNSLNDRIFAATVDIEGGERHVAIPASGFESRPPVSGPLRDVAASDGSGLACSPLPENALRGTVALILRGECFFEDKLRHAEAAGAIAAVVYTDAARPDPISMDVGPARLPASMVGYRSGVELKEQLAEMPLNVTLRFQANPVWVNPHFLNEGSSRGPGPDAAIKPDLVAVGTSVYTARPGSYTVASGTSVSAPMVAGAAALLKAARPGLTVAQYRSLLINSTRALHRDFEGEILSGGAGILQLEPAMRNTIAAAPASLSFGFAGQTANLTRSLVLTNLSGESGMFHVRAAPAGDGPKPELPVASVWLDPGESKQIEVRWPAADLTPGQYQGFLRVSASTSEIEARIPYWFGVPSEVARHVTVLSAPDSGTTGSLQFITIRITDAAGIPIRTEPQVSVVQGGGSVEQIRLIDSQAPGAFRIRVRLGMEAGPNVFRVQAGEIHRDITIRAR
ncbi:MAG: S8 family serine peptidase [Bryobacteraceae bacterium]